MTYSGRNGYTPGHSRGLFSAAICGREEYIVLGSDAAYLPESFSERIIPGFAVEPRLPGSRWNG